MQATTTKMSMLGISIGVAIWILFVFVFGHAAPNTKILLSDIQTLTLRSGERTTGRRSAGVPQLECTSGCDLVPSLPTIVQCVNKGANDQGEIQWKCEGDLIETVRFGNDLSVICEGYDSSADNYILKGSCALEYSLESVSGTGKASPTLKSEQSDKEDSFWVILLCFIAFLVLMCIVAFILWKDYEHKGRKLELKHERTHSGLRRQPERSTPPSKASNCYVDPRPPPAPIPLYSAPIPYTAAPQYHHHYRDDTGSFVSGMLFQDALTRPARNPAPVYVPAPAPAPVKATPIATKKAVGFAKTVKR